MSSFENPTFNIGGLASGLDTNAIVGQLMAIERRPRVRLEQRQRLEEARQTALRDVQTRLRNLQSVVAGLRDVGVWGDVQKTTSSDATRVDVRRIGGAAAGGYSIEIDALARAAQATQGTSLTSAADADTLRITAGSTTLDVEIGAGDTLQEIADQINGSSGAPVYASVVNDKLVLSGKETGASNTIAVSDGDTGNSYDLAAALGFTQTQAPANADFTIDGTQYTDRGSNVLTDVLPGVEITLKATTGSSAVGISVSAPAPDSDSVKAKVQGFIEQYNSTIEFVRSKLNEERVANPATDAARAKGILRSDPGLTALVNRLRQSVTDVFSGSASGLDQLSEVGLTTGASTGTGTVSPDAVAGKLALDATKLVEKLVTNFGDVKKLFTNVTAAYESEGLAQRFDRLLDPWLKGSGTDSPLLSTRITASQTAVTGLKDQMTRLDTRLALRERNLRADFVAMEQALQQTQQQGSWLQSQLLRL